MPFININKRAIHYDCPRKLPSSVGHTVLLVHGAGDDRRIWKHVYAALENDHTPIGLDLPGRLSSDWPALESANEQVEFIAALVDALGLEQFVVCGHSMGGSIAMYYTLEHGSRVSGLIPVGSSPEWDLSEFEAGDDAQANADPWLDPDTAYAMNLDCLFSKKTSSELIAEYDRQIRQTSPRSCRADFSACGTFDLRARLKNIKTPTCVICGDEEEWKDGSVAIHEHVSGSSFHEIPEAGHAVAIEQPQAIIAVIKKFLASLS
jgi:3-oxoadipate enol-lactonase